MNPKLMRACGEDVIVKPGSKCPMPAKHELFVDILGHREELTIEDAKEMRDALKRVVDNFDAFSNNAVFVVKEPEYITTARAVLTRMNNKL